MNTQRPPGDPLAQIRLEICEDENLTSGFYTLLGRRQRVNKSLIDGHFYRLSYQSVRGIYLDRPVRNLFYLRYYEIQQLTSDYRNVLRFESWSNPRGSEGFFHISTRFIDWADWFRNLRDGHIHHYPNLHERYPDSLGA